MSDRDNSDLMQRLDSVLVFFFVSVSMNGHAHIPSSNTGFAHPTQSPTPFGNGCGESAERAGMSPSRQSSLPPLPPYLQIPTTLQPFEFRSQNFIPGSSHSRSVISGPSPVFKLPPLSPFSSSFRGSSSTPVANKNTALPPIPFTMKKAHKRANSDIIISGLNSLLAQNNPPKLIYPKPMEMPVGVRSRKENIGEIKSHGEAPAMDVNVAKNVDDSEEKTTSGVKRNAGRESAPSNRLWRSVSVDSSLNGKSSIGDESPPKLPPSPGNLQGVTPISVDGNDNALEVVFTASELNKIAVCDKLKAQAASDPKSVKRRLANRMSAARSKEKKARYLSDLEDKNGILEAEVATLTAQLRLMERAKMGVEEENKRLRIRLDGKDEQARLLVALNEQLTGEVHRLKLVTGEVSQYPSEIDRSNRQSLDANMLQQLNINQLHQPQTNLNLE